MEHDTKQEAPKKSEMYLYKSETTSWGSLISLLIVITIIIVGAFYAWGERIDKGHDGGNQNLPSFKVEASGEAQ